MYLRYPYIALLNQDKWLTRMTQQRRRRRATGLWRRRYITAIITLLVLGTLSTFALTYVQTELEEPWGAQYTLTYTGASIELSNPQTTIVNQDSLYVEFDITPSDKNVKCKFVITPMDINGDPIDAQGTSRTTTVTWYLTAGGSLTPDSKQTDAGLDMETTHNMPSLAQINKVRIRWTNNGFLDEYESAQILIEDIE